MKLSKKQAAAAAEAFGEKPDESLTPDVSTHRLVRPSASKTDLYLTCAWPWGKKAPPESVGVEARFGSAFHEVLASRVAGAHGGFIVKDAAKRYGVKPNEVAARVDEAYPVLLAWLKGGNAWGVDFTRDMAVEKSFALALNSEVPEARAITNPTLEGHVYEEAQPHELPGTLDLYARATRKRVDKAIGATTHTRFLLVLDHKSGYERQDVSRSGQLKTNSLMVLDGGDDIIINAFLHAPANMAPVVFADEVEREELQAHHEKLVYAFSRRDSRSLTPSLLCARCPAFPICPTNTTGLMDLRGGVGKLALTTPEAVGRAHQTLHDYKSRFEALYKVIDAELHDAVDKLGFGVRPDGRVVEYYERPNTHLSLASIDRALPPDEARKLKALLEKKGVIEHGTRRELRAGKKE